MQALRNICLLLLWLALVALINYELAAKAPHTPLGPLPGAQAAAFADRTVRYRAHTGLMPIDRLLHEGKEAWVFYQIILTGGAD